MSSDYRSGLLPQHTKLLAASGISPAVAQARGYRSVTDKGELAALAFAPGQCRVPTLLVPVHTVAGTIELYQHRPDAPRIIKGKALKYETPRGARLVLDVPPTIRDQLADPTITLLVTEGARKADAAVSISLVCIALLGVWGWRGTNTKGGKTALPDWEAIALNGRLVVIVFDSDVTVKAEVYRALVRLTKFLESRGAAVRVIYLPQGDGGTKIGLDDYLAAGHSAAELLKLATPLRLATPAIGTASSEDDLHLTDLGNAKRLVCQHGHDLRFCPKLGWLVWDGRRWAADSTGEVMRRAKATVLAMYQQAANTSHDDQRQKLVAHAEGSESETRLRAMVKLAETEPSVAAAVERFDADPWVLNVLSGTLDLHTGRHGSHHREDLITKLAPVAYDPEAQHDIWDTFLTTATGGDAELSAFLQRAVGYTLTGSTEEEKLFFAHGPEATGKSTFMEAIKATLGDYAATADFEAFLVQRNNGGPRNDLARLAGARLVASVEVEEGKCLAQGLVKQLTGGDTVSARFLYREFFEFKPKFKLWLAANHAPKVADADGAMWRRILRVPFEHTIPKEARDPKVKATLRDPTVAGPAILAWAVRGCLAWQRDGLGVPPAVEQSTAAYRADMDPLRDFVTECCVVAPQAWCTIKSLWEAYQAWAKESGLRWPLTKREFGERLTMRGFPPDRGGKGGRVRRGIALADGEVAQVAHPNVDSGNSPIRAGVKEVADNATQVRHLRHPPEPGNGSKPYGDHPPLGEIGDDAAVALDDDRDMLLALAAARGFPSVSLAPAVPVVAGESAWGCFVMKAGAQELGAARRALEGEPVPPPERVLRRAR